MKQLQVFKNQLRALIIFGFAAGILVSCQAPETKTQTEPQNDSASKVSHDPLPGWNNGDMKTAITTYVKESTDSSSKNFIPVNERIAVFDNDGTLWAEQPLYFQFFFCIDRIREMAPQHPEWKTKEPFKSILAGDIKSALASGEKGLLAMMAATFAGMKGREFNQQVGDWIANAKHPITHKSYTAMVYQPMVELLQFLRSNGFKTFIVSGGDINFMRPWTEKTYGIPPDQVVGSSMKSEYQVKNDTGYIQRLPQLNFLDDGPGKPEGIYQHIGRRPVFAAGNSDGDYQMLQWTSQNKSPHMEIIIHHTDSIREWAYDRNSKIGKLDKGLDDASKYGWKLVDMKNDWKIIYPE